MVLEALTGGAPVRLPDVVVPARQVRRKSTVAPRQDR
jgi:hypothetical protein